MFVSADIDIYIYIHISKCQLELVIAKYIIVVEVSWTVL